MNLLKSIATYLFALTAFAMLIYSMGGFTPSTPENKYWKAYTQCVDRISLNFLEYNREKLEKIDLDEAIAICNKIEKP